MLKKLTIPWLLVIAYFIWVVVIHLVQDGMFTDGILYAAVSRNFYLGMGSWWNLHLSQTLFNNFHEQPPLFFWLQSFFFLIIGDTIYPERIFCLVMAICTTFVIVKFWRKINTENNAASWLPVLLLLSIPVVSWGLKNNVIENALLLFDLLSIYFLYRSFMGQSFYKNILFAILFLIAASLSKGIQGLFPLAAPVIYYLCTREIKLKKAVLITTVMLVSLLLFYFLLMQNPSILESYKLYFASRFPGFPNTPNQNSTNRLWLLLSLILEMLLPLFIVLAAWFTGYLLKIKTVVNKQQKQLALFFLLVGLSASLPLMISFEQRRFYLITSLPYFVLALSFLSKNLFQNLSNYFSTSKRYDKVFHYFLTATIIAGILFTFFTAGKIDKDKALLNDIYLLKKIAGQHSTISVSEYNWSNWPLQNYCQRYANISLLINSDTCLYHIQAKNEATFSNLNYEKLSVATEYFTVFKKK